MYAMPAICGGQDAARLVCPGIMLAWSEFRPRGIDFHSRSVDN
jgi:hypothetical protein